MFPHDFQSSYNSTVQQSWPTVTACSQHQSQQRQKGKQCSTWSCDGVVYNGPFKKLGLVKSVMINITGQMKGRDI